MLIMTLVHPYVHSTLNWQVQANHATAELQGMWRKHEAARAELREMRDAWATERHDLEQQVGQTVLVVDIQHCM